MAIKDGRERETKKRKRTNATTTSSVAMAEVPPQVANHVQPPPPPLPPGVYFSPTRTECLELLNRSIAGDNAMPARDTWGCVRAGNIYGQNPDALRQQHPPASIREGDHTWWFLSQTKFQSQEAGGGASKRADRRVETGGYWRLEQSKQKLDDDGFKNTFGYYVDGRSKSKKKYKTQWLMQEFTSANDDGAGKGGVPALYRVYVTPRATYKQQREVYGEDGVKVYPDGKTKKPARAMVPEEYFDRIAELLPQGSVRPGVRQEHVQEEHYIGQYELQQGQPPPLPPVAPEGFLGFYSQQEQYHPSPSQYQQEQYLGEYEQQEGQYSGYQQDQYLGQYEQQQGQYSGYQQDQYLGQYEQQQGPPSMVAPPLPPPASPGLLAELAGDAPPDNLSMPMADLMRMIDDNEQPAETVKGGEPNWESLDDIVDDDELANFNKES